MSSDCEAAFLEWEDAYARREPAEQLRDDFRAAFMAGVDLATREPAAAARRRRAEELCAPLRDASDEDLRDVLIVLGANKRKRLLAALTGNRRDADA